MKKPSAEHMMEFVECYRRGLAATGTQVKPAFNTHFPAIKSYKTPVLHMKESSGCKLSSNASHFLFQCPDFRNMMVEQRQATSQRLKACGNCLGEDHSSRNFPSKRSCWICGRRHLHSSSSIYSHLLHLLHRLTQSSPSCILN